MKKIFALFVLVLFLFLGPVTIFANLTTKTFGPYSFGHDSTNGTIFLSIKGATERIFAEPNTYREILLITNAFEYKSNNDVVFMTVGEEIIAEKIPLKVYTGKDAAQVFDLIAVNMGYKDGKTQLPIESKDAPNIFKLILDYPTKIILNDKTYYFRVDLEKTKEMVKFLEDFKRNFPK